MPDLADAPTPGRKRGARQIRRRPKDRKAQIVRAAAEMFNRYGYHGASMQDIAARVGISAPALYRHYPNKYALFSSAMIGLLTDAIEQTAGVDALSDEEVATDPYAVIDLVVGGLVEGSLVNRRGAGIYRWRGHHLDTADLGRVVELTATLHRRIERPLTVLRPEISGVDRMILQWGVLSVAGSVIDHGTVLPTGEITRVLSEAAHAVVSAQLPDPGDAGVPNVPRVFDSERESYEELLRASMTAFGRRGYAGTTMADLAEANDVSVTELYRHFQGKSDILAAAIRWFTNRVARTVRGIIAAHPGDPRGALVELIKANAERVFANPELITVYFTEMSSLDPEEQKVQAVAQRAMRDTWVDLLTGVRPELSRYQARFLVHAATDMTADLCRVFGYNRYTEDGEPDTHSAHLQACLRTLMQRTLFGEFS